MILAFVGLGALVGFLVGASADSAVKALIPVVFAFGGGSVIALQKQLDQLQLKVAFDAISSFSFSCLVAVVIAIGVGEYQLLTPQWLRNKELNSTENITTRKYLRSEVLSKFTVIDQQLRNGTLSEKEFIDEVRQIFPE